VKPKKRIVSSLMICLAVFSAGASSGLAKEFKLGLITPASHAWTKTALALADELKSTSQGKHSIAVFHSSQLGKEAAMLQQLQSGALELAFLTVAEVSNRIPDFGAFYAPYLVQNLEQAARLLRSPTAAKLLATLPNKLGVVGIAYGMAGMRQILTRHRTDTVADLQGRKLRINISEPNLLST